MIITSFTSQHEQTQTSNIRTVSRFSSFPILRIVFWMAFTECHSWHDKEMSKGLKNVGLHLPQRKKTFLIVCFRTAFIALFRFPFCILLVAFLETITSLLISCYPSTEWRRCNSRRLCALGYRLT